MQKILVIISVLLMLNINAFAKETKITYEGQGKQTYEVEVPSRLVPGQSGEVKLYGTWVNTTEISIDTNDSIVLTNSIDNSTKELYVEFEGIRLLGDTEFPVQQTKVIKVEQITDALFGEWTGNIVYNISVTRAAGLYDNNGNILCTWEQSGIDIEQDYTIDNYDSATTSGNYVITNKYPTSAEIILPQGITHIGDYMFYECSSIEKIKMQDGLVSIGDYAFYNTGITELILPSSLKTIGDRAFYINHKLNKLVLPNSIESIGDYAFYYCSDLTELNLPNSITYLGEGAFSGCTGLTEVIIPDSLTDINNHLFSGCYKLEKVKLPNTIVSIGNGAFLDCERLAEINIPNSVTSIGEGAFFYCENLTNIVIPDSVTEIGNNAFKNVPNITYNGTAEGYPWGSL